MIYGLKINHLATLVTSVTQAAADVGLRQGCQIFLDTFYQNGDKIINAHKICQIAME
jgi:citrate lyase alpha subunit